MPGTSCAGWSTATSPPTSTAGSGWPGAAPTRRRTSGSSTRSPRAEKFDPDGSYVRRWVPGAAPRSRIRTARSPGRLSRADRRPRHRASRGAGPMGEDQRVTTTTSELIVPRRFHGPTSSGNGGWTSGALAERVDHDRPTNHADPWPAIRVALRQPPPLDTPLEVTQDDGATVASLDGAVVARAEVLDDDLTPWTRSRPTTPARPWRRTPGYTSHPFPSCFACGTEPRGGRRPPDLPRPGRADLPRSDPRGDPDRRHLDPAPERRRGLARVRRRPPAGLAPRHLGGPGLRGRLGRRPRPSG